MTSQATRIEPDLLGEKEVPADAYYGVQTARALENFHISGVELRLYPNVIKAFAMVKLAAARANVDCGQFSKEAAMKQPQPPEGAGAAAPRAPEAEEPGGDAAEFRVILTVTSPRRAHPRS
jgi:Lyase